MALSDCCDKIPDKRQPKGVGFILAHLLGTFMVRKAWPQEKEADDHVAATVGEQRVMDAGAQLAFTRTPAHD